MQNDNSIRLSKLKSTVIEQLVREGGQLSYSDEVMFGMDLLYKVEQQQQMQDRLHKYQVAIVWRQDKFQASTVGRGSGILISKDLVLTVAHNFYHKMQRVDDKLIEVYVCQFGPLQKPSQILQIFIPEDYRKLPVSSNLANDYALIKLKQKVDLSDFIPLRASFPENICEKKVAIFGYPSSNYKKIDKFKNVESVLQSGFVSEDRILQINQEKGQIIHTLSTLPGQSGSPMILLEQADHGYELSIIGIHKGGLKLKNSTKDQEYNVGRILTPDLLQILWYSAANLEAEMFNLINHRQALVIENSQEQQRQQLKQSSIVVNVPTDQAQEWFLTGQQFQSEEQYQNAVKCYCRALSISTDDFRVYRELGFCLTELQLYDQAILNISEALKLNKSDGLSFLRLANALMLTNKMLWAASNYKKALQLIPSLVQCYQKLGTIFYNQSQWDQAILYLRKASKVAKPKKQTFFMLADALNKTDRYHPQQKTKQFDTALNIYHESKSKQNNKMDEILLNLHKAIAIDPNYQQAREILNQLMTKNAEKKENAWFQKFIE